MPYVKRTTTAGKTVEIEYYYTSRYQKKGQKRADKVKPTREESRAIKEEVSKIEERQAHAKKELTVDEFVDECKLYAKNIDCFMDGNTVTALYEKVEEMREDKIPLTVENAEALIEEAADRAEKPKLFSKPKYDKNGCLIITEDHFNF